MTNVVPLFRRIIVLKDGRTYKIPDDDAGVPAADYFREKGVTGLPDSLLRDARVYVTPDGPWIARPE